MDKVCFTIYLGSSYNITSNEGASMSEKLTIDEQAAHHFFSVHCFNRAWDLIDKTDRTPAENEEMISCTLASLWHWLQRPDCTFTNLSVAYWQVARVYSLLEQLDNARRYGQLCLEMSQVEGTPDFCLGYAYEILARIERIAGDKQKMQEYLDFAHQVTAKMVDLEAKKMLLEDLSVMSNY
jgi:hypothetical protein